MKVSKLIREHIEDQITKLYRPTLDKIRNEIEVLDKEGREEKDKIKDKAEKVMRDFLKKEGFVNNCSYDSSVLSFYSVRPKAIVEKIEKLELKKQELKTKRDNTIMNILLELELGGTKETLDQLLEKAIKDFSKIK